MTVMYLFVREKFHWSVRDYTFYETVSHLVPMIGALIGFLILRKVSAGTREHSPTILRIIHLHTDLPSVCGHAGAAGLLLGDTQSSGAWLFHAALAHVSVRHVGLLSQHCGSHVPHHCLEHCARLGSG